MRRSLAARPVRVDGSFWLEKNGGESVKTKSTTAIRVPSPDGEMQNPIKDNAKDQIQPVKLDSAFGKSTVQASLVSH